MRTPLTSALGYLQMLEQSDLDTETRERYLETVRGRLAALSALMSSLFEFARVIEGNDKLALQQVNIGNLLRDTLSASYGELDAKGFSVEVNIPDNPIFWQSDEEALRRILQNLLKNVTVHGKDFLRVTPENGVIELANHADGLDEIDTARLFERFYTADASRTGQNTGPGLAIARELSARMGGEITAAVAGGMLVMRVMPGR